MLKIWLEITHWLYIHTLDECRELQLQLLQHWYNHPVLADSKHTFALHRHLLWLFFWWLWTPCWWLMVDMEPPYYNTLHILFSVTKHSWLVLVSHTTECHFDIHHFDAQNMSRQNTTFLVWSRQNWSRWEQVPTLRRYLQVDKSGQPPSAQKFIILLHFLYLTHQL